MIAHSRAGAASPASALFTLAMVALCVGLGLWQLQRRVEKHALIAALDRAACGRAGRAAAAVRNGAR